jgi:hypothetical protein
MTRSAFFGSSRVVACEAKAESAGAIGAAVINWCGSFAIAGCCKYIYIGFKSRVHYKKIRKERIHGV